MSEQSSVQTLRPKTILEELEIKKGMKVAELGCGSGFFTLQAAKMVGGEGLVYAVDILKPALESIETKARNEGLDNVKTVWSNLEIVGATKIQDEILDYVFVFNVLFQAEKRKELLKEAARMLKKGGRMAIVDWKTNSPLGPSAAQCVSPEEAKKMAAEIGLRLEKEFESEPSHYGLVFRKL